jgi:glycine/D-amino acid oxidase-like deaminating enzyme
VSTAYHLLDNDGPLPLIAILEAREACSGATGRNGKVSSSSHNKN